MSELNILDVGHGNCAVLTNGGVLVIDAGRSTSLLEFLEHEHIRKVDVVLLSHADADHIGGLMKLIASGLFEVGLVRLNADASKDSKLWDDLIWLLSTTPEIDFQVALTTADVASYSTGNIDVEVLAPSTYLAGKSAGSVDRKGRRLTSNSNSVVVRLSVDGTPCVLLPGDIDLVGLHNLLEDGKACNARVVVFPHHGGLPGGADVVEFTEEFCKQTQAEVIIFSIGRANVDTPRPELVEAVRRILPDAKILCTQLSVHCSEAVAPTQDHLLNKFAQGRAKSLCCGGTLTLNLDSPTSVVLPEKEHAEFVQINAPTALCSRK